MPITLISVRLALSIAPALCLINNIGERKTDEVIDVNLEIIYRANRGKWGKQEIWTLLGLGLNYSCVTLGKM